MSGLPARRKNAQRDQRHARFAHQPLAEGTVLFIGEPGDAGGEKIGAFAGQHVESRFRASPAASRSRLSCKPLGQVPSRKIHLVRQAMGDAQLQRRRRGEGEELVRLGDHRDQRARPGRPSRLSSR